MEEEQKWIRDIQRRGSRRAADNLVRAYYDEIYRFAVRQVGNKEDAMDLTQTIFLAVLRSLSAFDGRKASFRTWLYRIAAHKAVYRLRLYGERTFPEIAAALGQPEAAVKTRYYRLMARLRKEFG